VSYAIVDTDGDSCSDWCGSLGTKNIVTIQGNKGVFAPTDDDDILSEQEIKDKIIRDLDAAYDGKASETFVTWFVQNWGEEDYIEMVNSFNKRQISSFLEPVDGRIWFAGDYTRSSNTNRAGESGAEVADSIFAYCTRDCQDDSSWRKVLRNGNRQNRRNCNWVAERPANRCRSRFQGKLPGSEDIVLARDACRLTCGTCVVDCAAGSLAI